MTFLVDLDIVKHGLGHLAEKRPVDFTPDEIEQARVMCLRNNLLKKILCDRSLEGGVGVYFHFRHPKTSKPVTAPKEDNVRRTGTKNARRYGYVGLLHDLHKFGAVPRPQE